MSTNRVEERQILGALRQVPPERWPEVLQYLGTLQTPATADTSAIQTAADLAASTLVGTWSDRDDLADSRGFARQLRRQAEQRRN